MKQTDQSKHRPSRALFASRFGAITATVGSAVGLGNIWRFPYEAGVHGGGAFLICYIAFLILLGIPVLCSEFIVGRASRSNIFGAYRRFSQSGFWHWSGYLGIVASLLILSFYSVVAGWTVEYFFSSVTGGLNFNSSSDGLDHFQSLTSGWRPVVWSVIFLLCNLLIMLGGVTKGIERAANFMMPLLFVLLVVFCIHAVSMPGASQGLQFLFHPDFSAITPSVLIGALGQAFFSLSLGLGCMMTYASYFKAEIRIARTAATIASLDFLVAIMAGIIIFPAVFSFGMQPAAGPTLVFQSLPYIFARFPGGAVWSSLFFLLLILASLTSTVSMSEISVSYFTDEKRMSRSRATILSTSIALVGAILCALSFGPLSGLTVFGLTIFDLFDYLSSNIILPLGGMVCSIFVGWRLDPEIFRSQLTNDGQFRFRSICLLRFALRWICPAAIFLIFLNSVGVI